MKSLQYQWPRHEWATVRHFLDFCVGNYRVHSVHTRVSYWFETHWIGSSHLWAGFPFRFSYYNVVYISPISHALYSLPTRLFLRVATWWAQAVHRLISFGISGLEQHTILLVNNILMSVEYHYCLESDWLKNSLPRFWKFYVGWYKKE
jgi:hypothetical protein